MSKASSRILYLIGLGTCLLATIPLIFGLMRLKEASRKISRGPH